MINYPELVAQAREWVGVPFLHQGRTRHGADCLGFIAAMLAELGSDTFIENLPPNYGRNPQTVLIDSLARLCRNIELQPAALILFRWPLSPYPSHAAIATDDGNMIHSYQQLGKVVEHGYRGPWVNRTASIWALPEVIYR